MKKLNIKVKVWDKDYEPKSCRECDLFCRCGMCIPCDSKKVEKYWDKNTKPEWCPLGKEE